MTASVAMAQSTVTASWDRNTDSETAGYRLYYGTASGSYQWSVDAGNQTSAPVPLSPGSLYYFTVRAYNANYAYGPPSNEVSIDLGAGSSAPTAQITATLQSANTALVTWQVSNVVAATVNGTPLTAASGSASVYVSGTTTFTLVATGATGATVTRSATVTAGGATSGLTADITATMQSANTALVTWSTANATQATINGVPLNAASGSASVYVSGTTTFTLVAADATGATVTRSATVP
jgi:hypothetical protein